MSLEKDSTVEELLEQKYPFGFSSSVSSQKGIQGLSEETIRDLSQKKGEPEYMLEFRLKAYHHFLKQKEPLWSDCDYTPVNLQDIFYYSAPKEMEKKKSLDEVDPEILKTFERLGIPLFEQKQLANVAVDAIFDSVSIATTYQKKLQQYGIIFCSISEAIQKYPEYIQKYLGSVVPYQDNYYANLNSAVFTDGSFCYIPKGVKAPMDLSSYFRINDKTTGQFERTLIIADEGSFVNYIEGCTAPSFSENQLHAAVVEIYAHKNAVVNYSTVQNWYPGDETGKGGIFNFVTKRGLCAGEKSVITWTQVEVGSAITWKYPSVILRGDHSSGEFYSVALTNHHMQADTGTKMIHIGKNTKSTIISKGISGGHSRNTYRGLVHILPQAAHSQNFTQCDSMIIGNHSTANTLPYIKVENTSSKTEHEATTASLSEDKLLYIQSRGLKKEQAISLLLHGFCQSVFDKLPLEFSVEAVKLLEMKLEDSVG